MIKSKITMAIVAALALGYGTAYAQSAPSDGSQQGSDQQPAPDVKNAKKLQAVTVTGSLIPQSQIETATPIITITADEMKAKGFTTVAEALQQSSFATGSVQGMQDTNSFTTGAETLSMFGLPVGFVKYLIDGRPMGNFPGLYNGSDTFNSLSGIPMDMVDHIDILPGGQSSLYGSDAIAGVINIVLKKHIDAPTIDVRYGWYKDGGGANRRISFADSFSAGKFNSLVGLQFDSTQPIWTKDRSFTKGYFQQGTSPGIPLRDTLVYVPFSYDSTISGMYLSDPNHCQNISQFWGGTTSEHNRPGHGLYCGSPDTPGAGTLTLDSKSASLYTHNTFDVNDDLQLYGDLLYNYSEKKWENGPNTTWWGTAGPSAGSSGGYFWDPTLGGGSLVDLQHSFAPEEVGGYQHIMNKQYENAYMLTLGARGTFGQSNWDYDLGFTHSDDHLRELDFQRVAAGVEGYYSSHVLGPQQGTYSGYPVFTPNYAAMWNPISQADFKSFTGYSNSFAKTWDNLLRGQLTNASLFHLPGGDAGIAMVVEGGNEGWSSTPDPRLLEDVTIDYGNGNTVTTPYFWGTSATPGAGHRSRAAATVELKLPVFSQLTADLSGRYDNYKVGNQNVGAGTYNLGLEYRPFESLLLRGRYGTAFKVPTLSDEFQLPSGYYNTVTDYLNCGRLNFTGPTLVNCPQNVSPTQYNGETYGNPALQPIKAKVWSYGVVWAPIENMSMSVDYLHWSINNEVAQLSADTLSRTEYLCDIGTIDPSTQTCKNAFDLITRGTAGKIINGVQLLGPITHIVTTKLNVANEQVNAITAHFSYGHDIGSLGRLVLGMSYSDMLKHEYQDYVIDPPVDLLRHPNYSTDFKSKGNASLTWLKGEWSATVLANRFGRSPNYAAYASDGYTAKGAAKLPGWIRWNGSVTYNPIKSLGLSLQVTNLFNKMPPVDHTYPGTTSLPYNTDNYNVYGRAMYLEANYKFGQGS
ncbi:TonB-dependent receptor [Rhodanobacter sp. B05]|uniref:TonB-dependent receptor domain-containing protein n=1 Tax=Rhodanobacter sp. B05 TaxID=1945859 RepID=UPI0009848549|nr:TonB-dependent receptor [Rhodanobacter sp. B05]OOG57006.1 TonB-dependent receptor [Rhodanobacter sp. B05]